MFNTLWLENWAHYQVVNKVLKKTKWGMSSLISPANDNAITIQVMKIGLVRCPFEWFNELLRIRSCS